VALPFLFSVLKVKAMKRLPRRESQIGIRVLDFERKLIEEAARMSVQRPASWARGVLVAATRRRVARRSTQRA
jgi:hypothetical protein